jgi:hypothetical protein
MGDDADRQAVVLLASLGIDAYRRFGAGQDAAVGDLVSHNGALVVQVRKCRDAGRACFEGADAAYLQASRHPSTALGVALVRGRGGRWVVTMTPETMARLLHAARVVRVALRQPDVREETLPIVIDGAGDT